jgi:hypothetical protein
MDTQPEALRLAEIMDAKGSRQRNALGDYWGDSWCNKAAAELRRLHDVELHLAQVERGFDKLITERYALKSVNAELLHWMKYIKAQTNLGHIHDTASAAVAKAQEVQ